MFYGQTESELLKKIINYEEKEKNGKTVGEVIDEWEEPYLDRLAYQTASRNKSLIRYANDFFGEMYIKNVRPVDVDRFMQRQIALGRARKTISLQMSIVNIIFKYACIEGYIDVNPAQYITVPFGLPKTKRKIPTQAEIEIIKNSVDCTFGVFAYFLLFTGLRKGEALALQYKDIDFKNKIIKVTKSVYWESNRPFIKTPKTDAGTRSVILLDCVADVLKKGKPNLLVFPDSDGQLMRHAAYDRLWKKYCNETGINITAHQLRHAYASYVLYSSGIDVKTAQTLMGHSDITTTQNIYTQVTQQKMEQTAAKLNEYVGDKIISINKKTQTADNVLTIF